MHAKEEWESVCAVLGCLKGHRLYVFYVILSNVWHKLIDTRTHTGPFTQQIRTTTTKVLPMASFRSRSSRGNFLVPSSGSQASHQPGPGTYNPDKAWSASRYDAEVGRQIDR